jgi:hypothetical protein
MNVKKPSQVNALNHDPTVKEKVLEALPKVLIDKTKRDGKVNFSLFKSTITNGKVKLIPHGNLRTPYLINNSMLSSEIAEEISDSLQIPVEDVSDVIKSIANEAQNALTLSSSFVIKGLCRIYMDSGKIRVSMTR